MLAQIASFLLNIIFGLLIGAALLRCYFNFFAVPMRNPLGEFLMALTDWLVRPLRRLFKPTSRFDAASFIAALIFSLIEAFLLSVMVLGVMPGVEWLLITAWVNLLRIALQSLMVLLIVYAVLSWINPQAPVYVLLQRIFAPLLAPLHRIVPLIGGVDLAPLVLIVILQIALMLLARFA